MESGKPQLPKKDTLPPEVVKLLEREWLKRLPKNNAEELISNNPLKIKDDSTAIQRERQKIVEQETRDMVSNITKNMMGIDQYHQQSTQHLTERINPNPKSNSIKIQPSKDQVLDNDKQQDIPPSVVEKQKSYGIKHFAIVLVVMVLGLVVLNPVLRLATKILESAMFLGTLIFLIVIGYFAINTLFDRND